MTSFALETTAKPGKFTGMKPLARFLVSALLLTLFLAGCEAPANIPGPGAQKSDWARDSWVARREAQLKQMGLKDGDAAMKARDEWRNLGGATESYTLYDPKAKQKAKQEKFESDLAKAPQN